MKRTKYAYPLYKGTRPYADFNIMLKGCAEEFSSRPALSYRENPSDKEAVRLSFTELYGEVADLATELLARGYAGKHAALIAPPLARLGAALLCAALNRCRVGAAG